MPFPDGASHNILLMRWLRGLPSTSIFVSLRALELTCNVLIDDEAGAPPGEMIMLSTGINSGRECPYYKW